MTNEKCGNEMVKTNVICYQKEISWEIASFTDWWSSRKLVELDVPENIRKIDRGNYFRRLFTCDTSTLSPIMHFEIQGIKHDFRIAILKCQRWGRHDERHDVMIATSVYYNGPFESIAIKPQFYFSNDQDRGYPIETETIKNGTFSIPRLCTGYSLEINQNLLSVDSIVIKCLLQVYITTETAPVLDLNSSENIPTSEFHIKDFEFSDKRKSFDQFSDFEIVCIDKTDTGEESEKRFLCHKVILSSNSPYYDRMFSSNFSENQGQVRVTDINSGTMETMLKYLYTRQVKKCDIDLQLFYAADKYEVDHLKVQCEKELTNNISLERIVELAVAASLCGSEDFKSHVFGFLAKQWNNIQNSDQKELIKHYPDILLNLLETA